MTLLLLVGTMSMAHVTSMCVPSQPQQCSSEMESFYNLFRSKGITIQIFGQKMDGNGNLLEMLNGLHFGFQMVQQDCTNIRCESPIKKYALIPTLVMVFMHFIVCLSGYI